MNQIEKIMALHDDAADWREAKGKDHPAAVESEQAFRTAIEQALTAKPNINCKSVQHRLATQWGYIKADDASKPVEVEPYAYIYETHGPFGLHQSLQCKPYNGVMPSRSVPVYTAPPARVDGWQPIETAPENMDRPVVVTWVDADGKEQTCFDYTEDGCWMEWHNHVEHILMIGGYGVSDEPPYMNWMPLPPAPQPTKD